MKITKSYLREMIKESLKLEMGTKKKPEVAKDPPPKPVPEISDAYGDFVKSGKKEALYEITQEPWFKGTLYLVKDGEEIRGVFSDVSSNYSVTGDIADKEKRKVNRIEY